MTEPDRHWTERQLLLARCGPAVEEAVLALMSDLAGRDLDADDRLVAVELFSELSRGRPVAAAPRGDGEWRTATPGRLAVGMRVRVRGDAFGGEVGRVHNGREGVVIEVSGGDVVMRSTDDRAPAFMSAHYSPHVLEAWIESDRCLPRRAG